MDPGLSWLVYRHMVWQSLVCNEDPVLLESPGTRLRVT